MPILGCAPGTGATMLRTQVYILGGAYMVEYQEYLNHVHKYASQKDVSYLWFRAW